MSSHSTAICKLCDSRIWQTPSGKLWYSGLPGTKRSTDKARCSGVGGKHRAARGTITR